MNMWHRAHRCACAVAACLGIAAAGCTDDSPSAAQGAAEARQEVVVPPRGEDPEYNARLKESVAERTALLGEMAKARAAYEAAAKDDPGGERTKELEAKVAECDAKLKDQRERARKMVTGRIWKELEDQEKADRAAKAAGEATEGGRK